MDLIRKTAKSLAKGVAKGVEKAVTSVTDTVMPVEELDKILLINIDEKQREYDDSEIIFDYADMLKAIEDSKPYLIIVTSQNSLSRTDNHFQHILGEKILGKNFGFKKEKEIPLKYKRLSKTDATKPIHSSSIFSKFFKKDNDPYNVRTRIYYSTDNVCLNFEDEELSKKSCFTNKKSSDNEYYSKSTEKCISQGTDITITNYYMKRYSDINEILSKTGNGIITIGLIFKIKDTEYKLIISNRCNSTKINPNYDNRQKNIKLKINNLFPKIKSSYYIVTPNNIKSDGDFKISTYPKIGHDIKIFK